MKAKLTLDDSDFRQNMLLDRNATRSFNTFLTEAQQNLIKLEQVFKGLAFDPAKFAGLTGLSVKIDVRALYKEISEAFRFYIPGASEQLKVHINVAELSQSINDAIGKIVIPKGLTIPVDLIDLDQKVVKAITDALDRETFFINVKIRRTELTNDIDDYFRTGYDPNHRVRMKVHVDRDELKANLNDFFDKWSPKLNFKKIKMATPDIDDVIVSAKLNIDKAKLQKDIGDVTAGLKLNIDKDHFRAEIESMDIGPVPIKMNVERDYLRKDIDAYFGEWDPSHRVRLKVLPNVDLLSKSIKDFFENYEASVNVAATIKMQEREVGTYTPEEKALEAIRIEIKDGADRAAKTIGDKIDKLINKPPIDFSAFLP